MASSRLCSIDECGKPARTRGWCNAHYERWRLHGDPAAGGRLKIQGEAQRFFDSVVLVHSSDGCLIWPFARGKSGYGTMTFNGRSANVHRLVCAATHGPAPSETHEAAHSCGNGHLGCCNPRHVRWATRAANALDMVEHGTSTRGEKNARSRLTLDQVRDIRKLRGTATPLTIANRYGVSRWTIHSILYGKNWKWLN